MSRLRPPAPSFSALIIAFVSLACLPASAGSGVGFQPVSADELKMTSEPQAPGAPAIILYRQVDRDDRGLTAHEDNYFRIKILTEEGRKYADIEIPFFKEEGNIVNIHARTIKPDGLVINFNGKIFDKSIVKAKGVKYMAKTFTLSDVEVGGIIEYFYTTDLAEYFVFDSHWILSNELFTKSARFSLHPYTSDYQQFNVRWSWHLLPAGSVEPKEQPDHITRATVVNMNETDLPFGFTYSFEADNYAKNAGNLLLVRPRVLGIQSSALLETKEPRKFAIEFEGPVRDTDKFEITIPPGFEVEDLPPPVDADYSFGSYHSKTEVKGNVIGYSRTFEVKELSVPVSKAEDLRRFYRIIASDERNTVVLKAAAAK